MMLTLHVSTAGLSNVAADKEPCLPEILTRLGELLSLQQCRQSMA